MRGFLLFPCKRLVHLRLFRAGEDGFISFFDPVWSFARSSNPYMNDLLSLCSVPGYPGYIWGPNPWMCAVC